jgi:hypothetical protein
VGGDVWLYTSVVSGRWAETFVCIFELIVSGGWAETFDYTSFHSFSSVGGDI